MIKKILLFSLFLFTMSFAQQNVELLGNLNEYPFDEYSDIWGYADSLGNEYALLCVNSGTSVINVTDPANPVEISFIPGPYSIWRDIKTHSHYAYVTTEGGGGMQVIDLSGLPESASLVNTFDDTFSSAHNLFIDEGYAYVIGTNGGGGMHIINLADPVNPVEVSYYSQSGYVHDVYVWDDTVVVCSEGEYGLVDVKIKSRPRLISESAVLPGIYAHSGWMTEDKRYFIGTEEYNKRDITVWDLQDRSTWDLKVTEWQMPTGSIVHNLFVKGRYAHISYYSDGYVVLDVSNPEHPYVAGNYDMSSFENDFHGAWGCYPYLPSGNILISSIEGGLYILKFTPQTTPMINFTPVENPTLITGDITVETIITDDKTIADAVLYYRTTAEGSTSVWYSIDDPETNNGEYNFVIPGQEPNTTVEYYVAAIDDSGNVTTMPEGGSGTDPVGNQPPANLYSYKVIHPGVPVIISKAPENDVSIQNGGSVQFNVDASDTSGLDLTYTWYRNTNKTNSHVNAYAYQASSILPTPRTDSVRVIVSNGFYDTSYIWYIHIGEPTDVKENKPLSFNLEQNYPNPFNPSTEIKFSLPEGENVNLSVFNLIGEKTAELINGFTPAGTHSVKFDAAKLTSGIYIARLSAGSMQKYIKMTLMK